jgi:hypothetical protein
VAWQRRLGSGHGIRSKTVETVSGEVVKVDRITPMRGMSSGQGDVSVHLGRQ